MNTFRESVENFDKSYGTVAKWIWRVMLYPFFAIVLYAGNSYLESNYVSRTFFDKTHAASMEERTKIATEQKATLQEMNLKLDAILISNAANDVKLHELDRRVGKAEDKIDRIDGK